MLPSPQQLIMNATPQPVPEPSGSDSLNVSLPKIIRFQELVRCGDEIWIEHSGQLYRLRKTKQDKLILTK